MHITCLFFIAYGIGFLIDKTQHKIVLRIVVVVGCGCSILLMAFDTFIDCLQKTSVDTRIAAINELEHLDITRENTYYEQYTPFCPSMSGGDKYKIPDNKSYVMISSYQRDRYNIYDTKYEEQKDFYKQLDNNYDVVYSIKPWLGYRLIMDESQFSEFKLRTEFSRLKNNITAIKEYLSGQARYFGPEIKCYKIR